MNSYTFSCGHKEELYGEFTAGTVIYCNQCGSSVSITEAKVHG